MPARHVGRHRPSPRSSRTRFALPLAVVGAGVAAGLVVADARADELSLPAAATSATTLDARATATANRSNERVSRDVARDARSVVMTVSSAGVEGAASAKTAADSAAAQADAEAAAAAKTAAAAKATAAAAARVEAQRRAVAAAHRWVSPVSAYTLTSGYGFRWGKMHPAQDLACPVGTPVHALSTGTVVSAGWSREGYGYLVKIRYWDGTVSWMAHNSRLLVAVGDQVAPGQTIARSGNTGRSTGPHVHLEIHPNDAAPVAPLTWFSTRGVAL
ncbi:MAG: M23 family metallopeptidase [Humibacillus sp.]